MKHNQKYIIPFKGLKDGKHIFRFRLEKEFFDLFEAEELNLVELQAEIQLDKKNSYLEADFTIEGTMEVICDVCLDYYPQQIESTGKLFIRFGEENAELSDELIVIPSTQSELDVSQYLYDFSMLGIPFKREHPAGKNGKSGCDPEMIKILRKLELKEGKEETTDPRWNNLKNLI